MTGDSGLSHREGGEVRGSEHDGIEPGAPARDQGLWGPGPEYFLRVWGTQELRLTHSSPVHFISGLLRLCCINAHGRV